MSVQESIDISGIGDVVTRLGCVWFNMCPFSSSRVMLPVYWEPYRAQYRVGYLLDLVILAKLMKIPFFFNRCESGYTGERCDVEVCLRYCLNDGRCSVSQKGEPTCACFEHYEGGRCENRKADEGEASLVNEDNDNAESVIERKASKMIVPVIPESTTKTSTTTVASNTESCK